MTYDRTKNTESTDYILNNTFLATFLELDMPD